MTLLFPAGLRRLSSEAWGWSWLIYEPSPHPAPPVSLVFLIFSSSSHVPKASPRNPAQRGFGNIGRLEHWPGGGGGGSGRGRGCKGYV